MASKTAAPGRYPRQIVIMVTTDAGDHLDAAALNNRVSMSEVARTYIDAGIEVGKAAADAGLSLDELIDAAKYAAAARTGKTTTVVQS